METSQPLDGEHLTPSQAPSQVTPDKRLRRILSTDLFAEAQEVQIEHAGETYRLRKTRAGKLILTK
ncbi:MAG: hemin uptake protein HemP [Planctomycetaceae bacterium]|nr:hemin uptake protein HemP [Planctomycetaceae bacterium]